jgi:hypothetical protein
MCQFGLYGSEGANPLDVFEEYKDFVKKGLPESKLLEMSVPPLQYFECRLCGFYSFTKRCECDAKNN